MSVTEAVVILVLAGMACTLFGFILWLGVRD